MSQHTETYIHKYVFLKICGLFSSMKVRKQKKNSERSVKIYKKLLGLQYTNIYLKTDGRRQTFL
jgi:hypothetical protein